MRRDRVASLPSLRREVKLAQIHFLTTGVDCRAGLNRREAAAAKAFSPLLCKPEGARAPQKGPHPFRKFIHLNR
jgi:hypothetical protein